MDPSYIIATLAIKYPVISSIVGVVGVLRLIFKPLFSFFLEVALATPSDADNKILTRVESSATYKTIVWLLDYVASIKINRN